jgi:transposase InsO family protein
MLAKLPQGTCACIHCDNGTEFKGNFEALCKSKGIDIWHTLPRHPWQNGKNERFWGT